MAKTNSITACLVIRNEERVLERCLQSIHGVVSEILVVHDGKCEDKSLEICKKYKCKVFQRRLKGEAEPHRAWLYKKVKTEWILKIDADEFLSKRLREKIPTLAQNKNICCYEFLWKYWNGKKYKTKNWPWKKILFQKDCFQFIAFPHEEEMPSGPTKRIHLQLEHRPNYDNLSLNIVRTKWSRWIKIHATYMLKDYKTLDKYPQNTKTLPHYYFIRNHPLIYALPLGIYHSLVHYLLGAYKEGWVGLKASIFSGTYYFLLCLEVYKLKHYE